MYCYTWPQSGGPISWTNWLVLISCWGLATWIWTHRASFSVSLSSSSSFTFISTHKFLLLLQLYLLGTGWVRSHQQFWLQFIILQLSLQEQFQWRSMNPTGHYVTGSRSSSSFDCFSRGASLFVSVFQLYVNILIIKVCLIAAALWHLLCQVPLSFIWGLFQDWNPGPLTVQAWIIPLYEDNNREFL